MTATRINDFVIRLANVNGTGSASANGLLMKTIFRMGVPVMGKNFFPSNIQGLPTWYEIRVTKDKHLARSGEIDIMVAMNAETYQQDLRSLSPGGVFLYDSTWPRHSVVNRQDVTILGVPLAKMCNEHFSNARARILMKNMAYVGALASLLELDREVIEDAVPRTFASKQALLQANMDELYQDDFIRTWSFEDIREKMPNTAALMDDTGAWSFLRVPGEDALMGIPQLSRTPSTTMGLVCICVRLVTVSASPAL